MSYVIQFLLYGFAFCFFAFLYLLQKVFITGLDENQESVDSLLTKS